MKQSVTWMGLVLGCALIAMPVLLLASVGAVDPIEQTQPAAVAPPDVGENVTVASAHVALVLMTAHMGGEWVELDGGERFAALGDCVVGVSMDGATVVMSAADRNAQCFKTLTSATLGIESARRLVHAAGRPCATTEPETMGSAHVRSCTTERGTAQVIVSAL